MFGKRKNELQNGAKDIGLLGTDSIFEGAIRFAGTLRIDGTVVGDITSDQGSGSVLVINKKATVTGDITSDSVLISGRVEGNVTALEKVEIFRAGYLKGDVRTGDIMIEGGAEFDGYCHMHDQEGETATLGAVQAKKTVAGGPAAQENHPGSEPSSATGNPPEGQVSTG